MEVDGKPRVEDYVSDCVRLCSSLQETLTATTTFVRESNGKSAPNEPRFHTRSTVGLMVDGRIVSDIVSGGPAFYSGRVEAGDYVAAVDGQSDLDDAGVLNALSGNHGSGSVTLLLEKGGKGGLATSVVLRREDTDSLLDRLKLFEHLRQLGVSLEAVSKDDAANAHLEEVSRLWTKIFRVDGMSREQNFQLQHNRVMDAQELCSSIESRLSAALTVCGMQNVSDQMSMQEETVALAEETEILEQRVQQVEDFASDSLQDAVSLIESLSRELEECQVQRKRLLAERDITNRKFTDGLVDFEVAKVENQGLSRQLEAMVKEGKGALEALQQSRQANTALQLSVRALEQELEDKTAGIKEAGDALRQAQLEMAGERKRSEERLEEAGREHREALARLRGEKEAADAGKAELQAKVEALSGRVRALEEVQGRGEGQRTAAERERAEQLRTMEKLKEELMAALKKARASEEDADQCRVALALSLQEQSRKEQAMQARLEQLQRDLADEKLVMEKTIRALEQRRGAKESTDAEHASLAATKMNRLKEELAEERKAHNEEVQGLSKARQSLEQLVSEYRQRIDDLHQKVTTLEADRLSPNRPPPPHASSTPSQVTKNSAPPLAAAGRTPTHPLPPTPPQHHTPSSRGGPSIPLSSSSRASRPPLSPAPSSHGTPHQLLATPGTAANGGGGWGGRFQYVAADEDDDEIAT